MSKYATGSYLITYFGKVGNKLDTAPTDSLTQGITEGTEAVNEGAAHSFVVSRVLFNSLEPDIDSKWVPK